MVTTASQVERADGRVELASTARVEASALYNEDLAPVPIEKRTWTTYNFAALWISRIKVPHWARGLMPVVVIPLFAFDCTDPTVTGSAGDVGSAARTQGMPPGNRASWASSEMTMVTSASGAQAAIRLAP